MLPDLSIYYIPQWYNFSEIVYDNQVYKGYTVMEITVTSMEKCDLVVVKGRIDSYTAPNLSETLSNITKQNQL